MGMDLGAGAGGAIALQEVLRNLFERANANQMRQQEQQRINIEGRRADDERAYRLAQQQSIDEARGQAAKAQAQTGALRIASAMKPRTVVTPDTAQALKAGDMGDLLEHQSETLPSTALQGISQLGAKAPTLGAVQSTENAGHGEQDMFTGTAAQLQAEQDRKARADELAASRKEREDARTQSAADRADLVKLTASLRAPAQTHGRYTTTQGTDANGKPVMIRTNVDTGDIAVSPVPDGINFAKREQPATQDQTNLGLYANRVEQSDPLLSKLQPTIQKMNPVTFKAETFLDTPYLQDQNVQSYQQASRNFINAVLRRESGAAISQSEFAEARKQYLPVPGDSDEVLKQKAQNRQIVLENFKRGAGPAYRPLSSASGGTGASPAAGAAPKRIRYDMNGNPIKD